MKMTRLYVRFYKSFNFDYERKADSAAPRHGWEHFEGRWFPYVRVPLDPMITAVVGANESGKSHLLDAVKILISGGPIERSDFCRYSEFYSVARDQMRAPEFGGEFELVSEAASALLSETLERPMPIGSRLRLFRPGAEPPYLLFDDGDEPYPVDDATLKAVTELLPVVFELNTKIALPDSVPIDFLAGKPYTPLQHRERRSSLLDIFRRPWNTEDEIKAQSSSIYSVVRGDVPVPLEVGEQRELGRKLLVDVCGIDPRAFADLAKALRDGREGPASGLIQKMNGEIARNLNLPRWWAQDSQFQLLLSPREHELCFTIRDRTGADYSFDERSRGLQYFLSYYVQLRAHRRSAERHEILLMDEPDAYLSSQGQQDLLRVLEDHARPEGTNRTDQVVYVTHSPFLINRNAGHRVRVIEKGTNDEGTRIVRDATRNHYEPLRSSLGAFVAETAFIGGSNLFVEGIADQVLLAGLTSYLRRDVNKSPLQTVDLNEVTIVPAGSAGAIPYMVYLARGRDQVHPPCVVLLDGDTSGRDAHKALGRGGARNKGVLDARFIVRIDQWAQTADLDVATGVQVEEPEDLIPIPVAVEAARQYARNLIGIAEDKLKLLRDNDVKARLTDENHSLWDALAGAFTDQYGEDARIEKLGFAKELVNFVETAHRQPKRPNGIASLEANFSALMAHLAKTLRAAKGSEEDTRRSDRLKRIINSFLMDHPTGARCDQAMMVIEEIDGYLEDSDEGDRARHLAAQIRREYKLEAEPNAPVPEFTRFCEDLRGMLYQQRLADQQSAMNT